MYKIGQIAHGIDEAYPFEIIEFQLHLDNDDTVSFEIDVDSLNDNLSFEDSEFWIYTVPFEKRQQLMSEGHDESEFEYVCSEEERRKMFDYVVDLCS